uniref:F-box domain-containing protein n=1 Tax=Steinernema glaseri TaxID=37863 RepID=A0A1I7YA82_9BILA
MEFVPIAFVDALCTRLEYEDLEELKEIENLWSSLAETHYTKRRHFSLYLNMNGDGTQVGMEIWQSVGDPLVPHSSLSKYDRINYILVEAEYYTDLPASYQCYNLHCFRTKVWPVLQSSAAHYSMDKSFKMPTKSQKMLSEILFSSLQGHIFSLKSWYTGPECIKFIEKQVDLGHIKSIELSSEEGWPQSLKSTLKFFLKCPNFASLEMGYSNLTVDLDMATLIVERFVGGDYSFAFFRGRASFTPEMLKGVHQESIVSDAADLYSWNTTTVDSVVWSAPDWLLGAFFYTDKNVLLKIYKPSSFDC